MNRKHESLECLAERMAQGDGNARGQLQQALQPHLDRIVRRALEKGQPSSRLARKIAAVAERLAPESTSRNPRPPFTQKVADCISQTLLCRLWPGGTELTAGLSTVA